MVLKATDQIIKFLEWAKDSNAYHGHPPKTLFYIWGLDHVDIVPQLLKKERKMGTKKKERIYLK